MLKVLKTYKSIEKEKRMMQKSVSLSVFQTKRDHDH